MECEIERLVRNLSPFVEEILRFAVLINDDKRDIGLLHADDVAFRARSVVQSGVRGVEEGASGLGAEYLNAAWDVNGVHARHLLTEVRALVQLQREDQAHAARRTCC